jgi:hypothetical protein
MSEETYELADSMEVRARTEIAAMKPRSMKT